ncbi:hypothetical protein PENTCL1PPCAC_4309, partial [Pristionchus entomophagus]
YCPPYTLFHHGTECGWQNLLKERLLNKYTTSDQFNHRGTEITYHKLSEGERVETIHDDESSVLCPAIIKKVRGRRVLLEYSRDDIEKSDLIKMENMWRDMN